MFVVAATGRTDVPFVVVRDGAVDIELSVFVSRLAGRGWTTFTSSYKSAIADLLNRPGAIDPLTGRLHLLGDVGVARAFVEALIKSLKGRLKRIGARREGWRIVISGKGGRRVSLLLIVMGALIAVLRDCGLFEGQSPLDVRDWHLKTVEERAAFAAATADPKRKGTFTRDVGRYFRCAWHLWIPQRTSDVRWFNAIMAALERLDVPEAVVLYVLLQGTCGCRPGEPQWLTFGAWLKEGLFGNRIMLRNKGSDEAAVKEAMITAAVIARIERYVDGARRLLDQKGRGMSHFRALAAKARMGDVDAQTELDATHVFLNTEGRRLTYDIVWYHTRTAFVAADIPATLHWLRHEYVFHRMRAIELIPDEAERLSRREDLADYMGWLSGPELLACYDAYARARRKLEQELAHMERRETAMDDRVREHANDALPVLVRYHPTRARIDLEALAA